MRRQQMRRLRMLAAAGMVGTTLAVAARPAGAQPPGDPVSGGRIAAIWCSNCHLTGMATEQGSRPVAQDAAPPFAALARRASTTRPGLRAFLQNPHRQMPDYGLTEQQREDLIAYILGR